MMEEAGAGETKRDGQKICEAKGGEAMGEQGVEGEKEVKGDDGRGG